MFSKYILIGALLQCFFLSLLLASEGIGQKVSSVRDYFIDIEKNQMTLTDAFNIIEDKSEYKFQYHFTDFDRNTLVKINMGRQTVADLLINISSQTNLKFLQVNNSISVRKKEAFTNMRNYLEIKIDGKTITGNVTSAENNEGLPGVNVIIKGTVQGTVTDVEGNYSLEVPEENSILIFSYVGFLKEEVVVGNQTVIDMVLTPDLTALDEIVVIGYGTQKKVNVIGSITAIGGEDLPHAPVSRVSNMLDGRLPGAVFMQGSGRPGGDTPTIRIRGNGTLGNNSALVVVDGIPDRDINSLNPDDIESISVLKDASAAIYGARAANGVILITTKRGATNTSPTFTFHYTGGLLSPTQIPELTDAATYAQMIREYQSYRGIPEVNMRYSLEDIEKYRSGEYPWTHPNTDWYEEVIKKQTSTRNYGLSLNGGTENLSYYFSYGSQSDDGIYKENSSRYSRNNVKANFDIKVNEYLSFGIDLTGIKEFTTQPTSASGSLAPVTNEFNIWDMSARMWPTSPARWPNGLPGPDFERGWQPLILSTNQTGFEDNDRYTSNNMLSATLKVPGVEGLSLSGYYAYDIYYTKNKFFHKPWTLYYLDKDAYLAAGNTGKEDGSAFLVGTKVGVTEPFLVETSSDNRSSTANIRINYSHTFNKVHNVDVFIAYEQNETNWEGFDAARRFFLSDQLPYLFAGGDEQKTNDGWVGLDARKNYFGRISYDYKGKYLFQFSLRRDGSLRFSEESGRWGTFPSVLAGWRISDEEWWKNSLDFFDLKLRGSYGQLGNDRVPPFQYLSVYGFTQGMPFGTDRTYETGISQIGTPNPLITWENANISNFGFEAVFFNKISFEADFFWEKRTDILVKRNLSVPQFTGITLPDENYGIVKRHGYELVLGYNDRKGDFSYGIEGNLNYTSNKVVEFDEPEQPVPWQVQTGKPMGSALLYKAIGIFRDEEQLNSYPHVPGAAPGDVILEDYNDDDIINGLDRQLFPLTTTPEYTYGVVFNLKYRNWALSGLIQGHGKVLKRLDNQIMRGLAGNYLMWDAEDRWTPDNMDATKAKAFNWQDEYWRQDAYRSTYFYHNIAYTRLKNLELSYTLPKKVIHSIRAEDMKIFFSGQNLWTIWSAQDIADPETANLSGAYPLMRIMSLGAQISF